MVARRRCLRQEGCTPGRACARGRSARRRRIFLTGKHPYDRVRACEAWARGWKNRRRSLWRSLPDAARGPPKLRHRVRAHSSPFRGLGHTLIGGIQRRRLSQRRLPARSARSPSACGDTRQADADRVNCCRIKCCIGSATAQPSPQEPRSNLPPLRDQVRPAAIENPDLPPTLCVRCTGQPGQDSNANGVTFVRSLLWAIP